MRRHLVPLALLTAPLAITAVGCNCGKPITMMTQASVTLPVEILDFGVVPEGTSKRANFSLENSGRAPVKVTITLDPDKSQEFAIGQYASTIDALGSIDVPVTFTPVGPGLDEGAAIITTEGEEDMPLRLTLKGGPIEPKLQFMPEPLAFGPGNLPLEHKMANIKSVGTSALNVRSVGIVATGNPYFAIVPPTLPAKLLPGESLAVQVDYTRTARNDTGFMEVLSDDVGADAGPGRSLLELFPDPPTVCTDRIDNDGDGLTDFPQDPGCQDAADETEDNAAQCVNGIMQPCDIGACAFAGMRTCANSIWGQCMGTCDAGVPDAGTPDAGQPDAGSCNPYGTYRIDGGALSYSCCDIGAGFTLVDLNITEFQLGSNSRSTPRPTQPGGTLLLTSSAPVCPNGSFSYERELTGTCNELYTLTGTFVDPNTFVGTYTATFTGSDCTSGLCQTPCDDQTWNISASR